MSNLLPEKDQERIRREYRARFILTGSYVAIATAVFVSFVILPSFSVLFISRPAAQARASQAQQSKTDSDDIAGAQSILAQVSPVVSASSTVTEAIAEALAVKPNGVHLDNIVYNTGAAAAIALGGSADTRALSDNYRTRLQADPLFTSVKLPVGDLLGSQDGRFTITLSGHF